MKDYQQDFTTKEEATVHAAKISRTLETKLVNNNLVQEERKGSMFGQVGPNFARVRSDFQTSMAQWKPIIEKTIDPFLRMNTVQRRL